MKNILAIAAACFAIHATAQKNDDVQINVPVKSVILYLDGAEVSQSKAINLNAGRTMVTFTGLSSKLISKSIQVNVGTEVTVLSVSDKINFLSEQKQTPRVKQLRDSIELFNDQVQQIDMELEAYTKEKTLLTKNESIGGQDKGVSIAELKLAADFYRLRLRDINAETFKLQKKRVKTEEALIKMQNQLSEQIGDTQLPTAEISILISSQIKTNTTVELKYVVKESGWVPSYD